jgi:hypothetical protein
MNINNFVTSILKGNEREREQKENLSDSVIMYVTIIQYL